MQYISHGPRSHLEFGLQECMDSGKIKESILNPASCMLVLDGLRGRERYLWQIHILQSPYFGFGEGVGRNGLWQNTGEQ